MVASGRTLVLQIVDRASERLAPAAIARSLGLPVSEESRAAVRAFIQSGLPLHGPGLSRAIARIRSTDRLSIPERARLAAVLEGKELLDSDGLWDRLVDIAGGGDRADEGSRRGARDHHAHSEGEADSDEQPPGEEPGRPTPRPDAGDDGRAPIDPSTRGEPGERSSRATDDPGVLAIAKALRQALAGSERADDPVQLFNHRPGREEQWIVVPIELAGAPGFRASVRIRVPPGIASAGPERGAPPAPADEEPSRAARGAGFLEAVIDIRDGESRWTFALLPHGKSLRAVVLAAPGQRSTDRSSWGALARRLARLGIDFDLRPMSKDSNDGFSTAESDVIIRSVDSRA